MTPRTPRHPHRLRLALAAPLAALALATAGLAVTSAPAQPQAAVDTWEVLPELPVGRQEVASVQAGGVVLVAGGKPLSRTRNHLRYDPRTGDWEWLEALPTPAGADGLDHVAAAAIGDRVFYVGGMRDGAYPGPVTGQVAVFDVSEGRFLPGAAEPMARPRAAGALVAHEGRLLYVGGLAEEVVEGKPPRRVAVPWLDVYDPATRTWTALPDMPTRRDHLGAVVADGRLWAVGGRDRNVGTETGVTEAFDLATGEWAPKGTYPSMAARRGGFAIGVVGERIVAMGGEGREDAQSPMEALASVEAFDVTIGGPWRPAAPMRLGGRHGMQAADCGGTLVVAGGAHRVGFDDGPGAGKRNEAFAPGGVVAEACSGATAPPDPPDEPPDDPPAPPTTPPAPAVPPAPTSPPGSPGGSAGQPSPPPPGPASPAPGGPAPSVRPSGPVAAGRLLAARLTPRAVGPRRPARLSLTLRAPAEVRLTVERRLRTQAWRRVPGRVVVRAPAGTTRRGLRASFAGRRLRPGAHRLTVVAQARDGRRTTSRLRFSVVR